MGVGLVWKLFCLVFTEAEIFLEFARAGGLETHWSGLPGTVGGSRVGSPVSKDGSRESSFRLGSLVKHCYGELATGHQKNGSAVLVDSLLPRYGVTLLLHCLMLSI